MRAIFLTGERVYLRGMLESDASSVTAWHTSVFPVNAAFAEEQLKERHQSMWDAPERQFAIVRSKDDAVVGGVLVGLEDTNRRGSLELHMAPALQDADQLQAEALGVLVPWLLDDHNMRRVHVSIASDDIVTIAAAESLGMIQGVRLREFLLKPGGRVDALIYQILNPNEEHRHA